MVSATVRFMGGPASAAGQEDEELQFIRVSSGYEAAAELLAAPAEAMVVDLGRITPAHAPLLDLANRLDVPVVAFGTVSADLASEQLSRIRLASAERITEVLDEALQLGRPEQGLAEAEPAGADASPPQPRAASLQPRKPRRPVEEALTQAELDALLEEES